MHGYGMKAKCVIIVNIAVSSMSKCHYCEKTYFTEDVEHLIFVFDIQRFCSIECEQNHLDDLKISLSINH